MGKYDIFISYRRKETADKAEHLFTLLEHSGYKGRVSFDRENFDGRFDIEILKRLDHCKDFIVVLAPKTLSELKQEDTQWYLRLAECTLETFPDVEKAMLRDGYRLDFVRLEIARALAKGKHIIPIVPINSQEYNFDNLKLPEDIALLLKEHAERYQDTKDFLFKDIISRICKRLKSRPNSIRWAKPVMAILLMVVLIGGIGCWNIWRNEQNRFESCRSLTDFETFAHETCFFQSACKDSLLCFQTLKRNHVAINDACNTGKKDSIRVNWSKDCSLLQLRTLRRLINNMIHIEKGCFIMGCSTPIGLEEVAHQETIENDFYIGKFEVTEREWNVVMSDTESGSSTLPMTMVSWEDCQRFVRKLQVMTGGLLFELPTEKQWEYAARKNEEKGWIYAGGTVPEAVANYKINSHGGIEEVGQKAPNAQELYDMSGNVAEWCRDGNDFRKRIRGGSYLSEAEGITVTYSDVSAAENKSKTIGLRLVLNP